jgi:predicted metalloprotease
MAQWDRILSRGNVEDRRGTRSLLTLGGGSISIGGIALLLLLNYLGGGDVTDVLTQLDDVQVQTQTASPTEFEGADSYEVFAATVLGSNNDLWSSVFAQNNMTYEPPTLVLFRDVTESACGGANSFVGPHYCPYDGTIYLDETFFDELQSRFGAQGGDVAEAYVIAHEVGHHVQNLLGSMDAVYREQSNEASIRLELQADCYAGLWAYSIRDRGVFEPGEIAEAIDAAAAVGDDRIQQSTTGRIQPENWTHGSSAERMEWFNRGYESGNPAACDM